MNFWDDMAYKPVLSGLDILMLGDPTAEEGSEMRHTTVNDVAKHTLAGLEIFNNPIYGTTGLRLDDEYFDRLQFGSGKTSLSNGSEGLVLDNGTISLYDCERNILRANSYEGYLDLFLNYNGQGLHFDIDYSRFAQSWSKGLFLDVDSSRLIHDNDNYLEFGSEGVALKGGSISIGQYSTALSIGDYSGSIILGASANYLNFGFNTQTIEIGGFRSGQNILIQRGINGGGSNIPVLNSTPYFFSLHNNVGTEILYSDETILDIGNSAEMIQIGLNSEELMIYSNYMVISSSTIELNDFEINGVDKLLMLPDSYLRGAFSHDNPTNRILMQLGANGAMKSVTKAEFLSWLNS
jgi:hypothetical protein